MNLYLKILQFLKPFWKLVILSILLTLVYVILNNLSLWISVDFIRELFSSQVLESVPSSIDSLTDQNTTQEPTNEPATDLLFSSNKSTGLYKKINNAIKEIIIQKNKFDTLKVVCLIIFLAFLLKSIVFYFRRITINFIELNIMMNFREKLYSLFILLPLSYFEKNKTGELTSIVFNDVNALNVVLGYSFGKLFLLPLQILTNLAILFLISWKLTLITLLIVPATGLIIFYIGRSIRRKSRRVFKEIANLTSVFQETITSIRIVKAFTNEVKEKLKFQAVNYNHFKKLYRTNRLLALTSPLNETIGAGILVTLLWYGGSIVYSGTGLDAEDFIRYLVFLFTMFQPMKELSKISNNIQIGLAAAERIFRTLESKPEVYEIANSKSITGFNDSIIFKDVSFGYDDQTNVLEDINLEINNGEKVAFVGHSGAGKTTLVDLIPRFYEITKGQIKIDQYNTNELSLTSLRKQIGIVTQDSILFNDTISMNVAYGLDHVSEDRIEDAVKVANAWEFIQNMKNGLGTVIGEKGVMLSGGQKQRLSIARAILKNPPILILDEATSALDSESEQLVQEAIDKLMENRTVLVIAHRLSTVFSADKIVVMKNGKITDIGNHQNLLKTSPTYRKLYDMQFRNHK